MNKLIKVENVSIESIAAAAAARREAARKAEKQTTKTEKTDTKTDKAKLVTAAEFSAAINKLQAENELTEEQKKLLDAYITVSYNNRIVETGNMYAGTTITAIGRAYCDTEHMWRDIRDVWPDYFAANEGGLFSPCTVYRSAQGVCLACLAAYARPPQVSKLAAKAALQIQS